MKKLTTFCLSGMLFVVLPLIADAETVWQPFFATSPATNETYEIDITKLAGQPFYDIDMRGNVTMTDVAMTRSKCAKRMYDKGILGMADVFTLYDYLDHDDVPLSLAMPSVECVPMVTAVELVGQNLAKLKVNPGTPTSEPAIIPEKFTGTQITRMPYKLDSSSFVTAAAGVRLLVAFPFRHFSGRNIDDFKVQVAMKVFVASGSVSVRPADGLSDLHPKDKAEWNQQSKAFTVDGKDPGDALAWSLYSDKVKVTIPNECKTQDDAVMQVDVMSWNGSADVPADQDFFTVITQQYYVNGISMGAPQPSYRLNLRPFKDGELLLAGEQGGELSAAPFATDQFRTYAMLWVRITDSSGNETYDLAPAVVADDMLNNKNNQLYGMIFGSTYPSACLLFGADQSTSYTYANILAGTFTGLAGEDHNWNPMALAVVDPRYNYAPEDWFVWNESSINGGKWLDKIQDPAYNYFGVNGRDTDIFMFTSNQGYVQSLGEFAFLPCLSQWNEQPGSRIPTILKNVPSPSATARHAVGPTDILNKDCAWRTYPVESKFYEDCASIGIGQNTGGTLIVNPFSDNGNTLWALFANIPSPCDYWTTGRIAAGTEVLNDDLATIVETIGDTNQTTGDAIKDASECLLYMFSEMNVDLSSRIDPSERRTIMQQVSSFIRSGDGEHQWGALTPWEDRYDELPWFADLDPLNDNTFKNFMGTTLTNCPLYSIDRKFLYSYHYDCFARRLKRLLLFAQADFPTPVTSIGDHAFWGFEGIKNLTIPSSVTNIGNHAFNGCRSLMNVVFEGNAPSVGFNVFSNVASGCTAYVKEHSVGWNVDIPGTWQGLNIRYVPTDEETGNAVLTANGQGEGTVTTVGNMPLLRVASGVTLTVLAPEQSATALATKVTPLPHEEGQDASLFKVAASTAADSSVSLAVMLDEEAVDPDGTAEEIIGAANMAVFGAAVDGGTVSVSLPSAKSGLYYGIAVASDLSQLDVAAANAPLVRAGADGATVPVVKPVGSAAFFKVIVSDRAR